MAVIGDIAGRQRLWTTLGKDNCKTRLDKFWELVWLILEVWWFALFAIMQDNVAMNKNDND